MVGFFCMYYVEEKWEAVGRIVGRKTKKEKKKRKEWRNLAVLSYVKVEGWYRVIMMALLTPYRFCDPLVGLLTFYSPF